MIYLLCQEMNVSLFLQRALSLTLAQSLWIMRNEHFSTGWLPSVGAQLFCMALFESSQIIYLPSSLSAWMCHEWNSPNDFSSHTPCSSSHYMKRTVYSILLKFKFTFIYCSSGYLTFKVKRSCSLACTHFSMTFASGSAFDGRFSL